MKGEENKALSYLSAPPQIRDIADSLWFMFDPEAREYCPPVRIRDLVGGPGLWNYGAVAAETSTYLKLLCGLRSTHTVLEVGCGCGRTAGVLKYFIRKPGAYYGFDPVEELIEHAKKIFDPDRFHFTHINLYSPYYNPDRDALRPENLKFPYDDDFFDVIYLNSVFTHLLPQPMNNYISEIARVLKDGKRCFATFWLSSANPENRDADWEEKRPFKGLHIMEENPEKDHFRVDNKEMPEDWVVYDLDYVLSRFKEAGMKLVHGPFFGVQSGNPEWLAHQDILVFEKTGTRTAGRK